ncbi:MAG: DUF3592 domain-containing protein [Chloroflexi bacterium]|nr:DUF3592 domain-containing protein [Chloroflexota bacterium]
MEFEFTEEELKSNRNGFLSPRQKELLSTMAGSVRGSSKNGVWVILGFMMLGLCILLALFLPTLNARNLQTLGPQMAAGLCFTVLAVLAMIVLSLFISNRLAARLESAEVLTAEGIVRHDSSYSSQAGFTSYYVYFGKKRFAFADDMNSVFPDGARLRVYYTKAGQIELIMSFEKLA